MNHNYFLHPQTIAETTRIGKNTRIWAFVHILSGAVIGENVNICDHCFIENEVIIGNDVTIKSGVYLWDGIELEDGVFIGPSATFANDLHPRSKNSDYKKLNTKIRKGATIGANATILPGVTIGTYALIGAGSVVTHDVDDYAVVYGNPAKKQGFVCQCGQRIGPPSWTCECGKKYETINGHLIFKHV